MRPTLHWTGCCHSFFFFPSTLPSEKERNKISLGALFLVATTEGVDVALKCLGISDSQLHSLARESTNYLSHCYGMPRALPCRARPKLYCQGDVKHRKWTWQQGRKRQPAQSCCCWANRPMGDWFVLLEGQVTSCPSCASWGWERIATVRVSEPRWGEKSESEGRQKSNRVKTLLVFLFGPNHLIFFTWNNNSCQFLST